MLQRFQFLLFMSISILSAKSNYAQTGTELNPSIEEKITLLLNDMTLDEKVGQTCQITLDAILLRDATGKVIEPIKIDEQKLNQAICQYKIGSILNVSSHTLSMEEWHKILSDVHRPFKKKETKTPILYGVDAIHGVNYTIGGTLFPQEIGLAATWNNDLAKEFGEVTAYELRATGVPWNFSPVMDLGRQPLWSRFFETLGEDPFLSSGLGNNIIYGYQGKSLSDPTSTMACLKHFVGYSYPLSGRDRTPAWIPEKYLMELYLPPFESTVNAGAMSIMINSGEVNGIPGHQNYHLLTEVLKKQWGFKGFTVSDWEDIIMLETVHSTAINNKAAIISAINAGVDMSMVPYSPQYMEYCSLLKEAVEENSVSMERLDDAVRRVLRTKLMLNLYEKPLGNEKKLKDFASEEFKETAKNAALESITLLKNSDNTLPFVKGKKILVSGPTANNLIYLNGAWTHTWQGMDSSFNTKGCLTIYQAVQKMNGKENTSFSQGVEMYYEAGWEKGKFVNIEDFDKKATEADVIVLCLGELPATEKPGDIRSLDLPEEQMLLAKRAYEMNKPVILILVEGRPRIIHDIVEGSSAILQSYLPGDYGGEALAEILFGEANPSGKLPYTYPKYNGVIEHYDLKKSEMRNGKSDKFDAYDPEWDFGFGLSYTNFEYSDLKINKSIVAGGDSITVTVTVKNTGDRDGKEVVQLYLSDLVASTAPWGKRLKGYAKVALKSGEMQTLNFVIPEKDFMFVNANNDWVSESGDFEVSISDLKDRFTYEK